MLNVQVVSPEAVSYTGEAAMVVVALLPRLRLMNRSEITGEYMDDSMKYCVAYMRDAGSEALKTIRETGKLDDETAGKLKAEIDKIFEPFYTARSGGTGLGLYISRELCELNRATLLYLDRPGGGSIFRIVFSDPDRWDRQDTE